MASISDEAKSRLNERDLDRIFDEYPWLNIESQNWIESKYSAEKVDRPCWIIYEMLKSGDQKVHAVFPLESSAEWMFEELRRMATPTEVFLDNLEEKAMNRHNLNRRGDLSTDAEMAVYEDMVKSVLSDVHWKRPLLFEMGNTRAKNIKRNN